MYLYMDVYFLLHSNGKILPQGRFVDDRQAHQGGGHHHSNTPVTPDWRPYDVLKWRTPMDADGRRENPDDFS